MTAVDGVLDALRAHGCDPRQNGSGWSARCPAHDDRHPSLSVSEGRDGCAVLHCHTGCAQDAVVAALDLDMRDLFPKDERATEGRRILEAYDYIDEKGTLLHQTVRYTPRAFSQRHPDGNGGWIWNLKGVRRVLYRLPDVREAVELGLPIFLCEGEKDADAVTRAGEVGTTNPMGAEKWRPEYADMLAGAATVFVVADRDPAGYRHARQVAASLEGRVEEVAVVEPVEGNDLSDHLAAGYTLDDLAVADLNDAHDQEPPPDEPTPSDGLFHTYSTAELLAMGGEIAWLVKGFLVHPTHGMLAGAFKTLKTYIDMFINIAIASGTKVFGRFEVVEASPVVQYVGEGGRIPHMSREKRVAEALDVNLADIPLFTAYDVAPIASERFQQSLRRDLDKHKPRITSIDPLYAFHGDTADAKNLYDEGALLAQLSVLCADAGSSLKIVNHFNQTGTGRGLNRITMAGAAEWCDSWWLVSHRETPDVPAGRFRLLLEIGSRQWGGSEWDLDINLGAFDIDTLTYDDTISWAINPHRATNVENDTDDAVIQTLVDEPWQHTRTELALRVKGNTQKTRASISRLENQQRIRRASLRRPEGGGKRTVTRDLYAMTSEPLPEKTP